MRNSPRKGENRFEFFLFFEVVLEKIWKESKLMNSKILFVGNTYKTLKFSYYTDNIPTYKPLEETQAITLVNEWINTIYHKSPPLPFSKEKGLFSLLF